MHAWLDDRGSLWLQPLDQLPRKCSDLCKYNLVSYCEEYDLLPQTDKPIVSDRKMKREVKSSYKLDDDALEDMDVDMIEFFWEWCHIPRDEICRALYDYFCWQNIISGSCAIDQQLTIRS